MKRMKEMDDNLFKKYIASNGELFGIDINNFTVGCKVLTKEIKSDLFVREIDGRTIYVNQEMRDSAKKQEVLTVSNVRGDNEDGYLVLSNGYAYYTEMIKEIL